MNKKEKFEKIFDEIHNLNVCGKDPLKVPRDISKTNINSKVMIIAEAMAPEQVRVSGVNYFFKDGKVGNTGKNLEKFLNFFNYTVYTNKKNCVYHTEIVHNFPGYVIKKNKKSIRRPNRGEIEKSLESDLLKKEIELLKPKLILLMGQTAYTSFYEYFLKKKIEKNLSEEMNNITLKKSFHKYQDIPIIPIQHSSGANPRFSQMLKNKELIELISKILNNEDLKIRYELLKKG